MVWFCVVVAKPGLYRRGVGRGLIAEFCRRQNRNPAGPVPVDGGFGNYKPEPHQLLGPSRLHAGGPEVWKLQAGRIVIKPWLHRREADGGLLAVCFCVVVAKPGLYRREVGRGLIAAFCLRQK